MPLLLVTMILSISLLTLGGCATDRDGDGFSEDCDDNDSSVHPFAAEICDGKDNNCDDQVDEGVLLTWYADADGDMHGDPGVVDTTCEAPPGYVADGTDCDDSVSTRFPGNPEVCDGLDNDCNELLDDGLTISTYCYDDDGDGYGDDIDAGGDPVLPPVEACSAPANYVDDCSDCSDSFDYIYPGASELCNGYDDDCNGFVDDACE